MDHRVILLISGVLLLLIAASFAISSLKRYHDYGIDVAILNTCRSRVQAWWVLFGLLTCALILGTVATVVFFFAISFWALREYITLTPTRPADHRTLFWVFFLWTPLQFFLVGVNDEWFQNVFGIGSYQVYSVLIPVYVFLILPAGIAISGDSNHFLERIAKIQVGLMICVYSLSFAPALLTIPLPNEREEAPVLSPVYTHGLEDKVITPLSQVIEKKAQEIAASGQELRSDGADLPPSAAESSEGTGGGNGPDGTENVAAEGETAGDGAPDGDQGVETVPEALAKSPINKRMTADHLCLLFFFIFLVQMSDIFQYLWSQFFRSGVIAKAINMNKTWGGVLAGSLTTGLLALGLWYFIPFPKWWQPFISGLVISLMGFAGNITLSAIKRDRGVADYGTLIEGHNGVLDRIDSLCFAAPIFYHLVWLFLNLEFRPFF